MTDNQLDALTRVDELESALKVTSDSAIETGRREGRLIAEAWKLKATIARKQALLKELQWLGLCCGSIGVSPRCPKCGRCANEGHAPDCKLNAELEGKSDES